MDCSLPGSSVHGILQARILKWIAIPVSRGHFHPRDRTWVSCIAGRFFIIWATREAPSNGKKDGKQWWSLNDEVLALNGEWCWVTVMSLLAVHIPSLGKRLFKSFVHIYVQLFVFLLLSFESSLFFKTSPFIVCNSEVFSIFMEFCIHYH